MLVTRVGELARSPGQQVEVPVVVSDELGRIAQLRPDFAGLEGGLRLLEHFTGGPGDTAHHRDVRQLTHPPGHLLHIRERFRGAQIPRRLDHDELLDCAADREVLVKGLIPDVAPGVCRQVLAVVVVELDQRRTTGQSEQDHEASGQVRDGPTNDMHTGTPPPAAGHLLSRLDPASPSYERDHCG
jgi:hypothetical protein